MWNEVYIDILKWQLLPFILQEWEQLFDFTY